MTIDLTKLDEQKVSMSDIKEPFELLDDSTDELKNSQAYSTTEVLTSKTWLGQPVYRKVIDLGAMPNSTSKTVSHGISGIVEVLPTSIGIVKSGSTWFPLQLANDQGAGAFNIHIRFTLTGVFIRTSNNYSSHTGYMILEYTKS